MSESRLTRKCPMNNCGKAISSDYFGCAWHWRNLPENHKRAILKAWYKWQNAVGAREGREALKELEAAQKAALEDRK